MEVDIEALDLDLPGHPEADNGVDDLEDDEGGDAGPDDRGQRSDKLHPDLGRVAVDEARLPLAAHRRDREHACQDSADEAADAVDAERVERVIVAEARL